MHHCIRYDVGVAEIKSLNNLLEGHRCFLMHSEQRGRGECLVAASWRTAAKTCGQTTDTLRLMIYRL